jgi:hypothetical protein
MAQPLACNPGLLARLRLLPPVGLRGPPGGGFLGGSWRVFELRRGTLDSQEMRRASSTVGLGTFFFTCIPSGQMLPAGSRPISRNESNIQSSGLLEHHPSFLMAVRN